MLTCTHHRPLARPWAGRPLESWRYQELQTLRTRSRDEEGRPQGGTLGRTISFTGRSGNHGSEPRPEVLLDREAALPDVRCVSSTKGGCRLAAVARTVTRLVVWCEQVSGQGETPGIFPDDWQCPQSGNGLCFVRGNGQLCFQLDSGPRPARTRGN